MYVWYFTWCVLGLEVAVAVVEVQAVAQMGGMHLRSLGTLIVKTLQMIVLKKQTAFMIETAMSIT